MMKPKVWKDGHSQIRAWDAEGFTTAEGIEVPLRVIYTEETVIKRERQKHQWVDKTEVHHWWWVTTLSTSQVPTIDHDPHRYHPAYEVGIPGNRLLVSDQAVRRQSHVVGHPNFIHS
jgi:hypothetical protein